MSPQYTQVVWLEFNKPFFNNFTVPDVKMSIFASLPKMGVAGQAQKIELTKNCENFVQNCSKIDYTKFQQDSGSQS